MDNFWKNATIQQWTEAHEALTNRIKESGKAELPELHSWIAKELPEKLAAQGQDRFITSEEYVKIVEWKLKRGTWRPRLLDMAKAVADEDIRDASRAAFERMNGIADADQDAFREICSRAIDDLTSIKGLGPATGSAILSAASPDVAYFADEAQEVCGKQIGRYTKPEFLQVAVALRAKAGELAKEAGVEGIAWDARSVGNALHSEHLRLKIASTGAKQPRTAKRKRS